MEHITKKEPMLMGFDIGKYWGGKVAFYSVTFKAPPFTKSINPETLGLKGSADKTVRSVTKVTSKFLCLPPERTERFTRLKSQFRAIMQSYRLDGFPFMSSDVFAVNRKHEDELLNKLDAIYAAWAVEREKLADELPQIRATRLEKAEKAAESLWHDNGGVSQSKEEFVRVFRGAFFDRFPSQSAIRDGYSISLTNMGGIRKSVELVTQAELVKDSETQAKLAIVTEAKATLRSEVLDWIAGQAAFIKMELFKALYPVVEGLKTKKQAITPTLAKRVEEQIHRIENLNLFQDATFAEFCEETRKVLVDASKASADQLEQEHAAAQMQYVLLQAQKGIRKVAFTPATARMLELDVDESPVFADEAICAEIASRMQAQVEAAAAEVAAKMGGTPDEIFAAENKARRALKLQELTKDARSQEEIDIANRAISIMEETAPATAEQIEAAEMAEVTYEVARELELDETVAWENQAPASTETEDQIAARMGAIEL